MKKRNINLLALAVVAIMAAVGCTDLEEFNDNPNSPTVEKANPALLLPKILYETGDEVTEGLSWGLGNQVMQLVSSNNFTGADIYSWGTYEGTWELFYKNARDCQNLYAIGEERSNDNLKAVSLVLKSWIFSNTTEMWGDIPYTEALAGKADGTFQPKYDNQKDIYTGILADYKTALDLFNTQDVLEGDIMFDGDIDKWIKFTNSLRIRTIMRLESKWSEMGLSASSLQDIVSSGNIMQSNDDNGLVEYLETAPNQWPLYTARVGSFDEKRMSQRAERQLKAIDDPRMFVLYRSVDNPDSPDVYRGVPNGLSEDNAQKFNGGAKNQSRLGTRFREEPGAVDMIFMHYAELQFILAEAAEKGYISGDAETYYLNGINANFEYYGLTAESSYLDQEGVDYNSNGSESKLELIAKQKWVSLFMVGLEGWFDWRRTGLPAIEPGQDALFNQVPVRIQYPDNEKVLNKDNYDAVLSRQGADEIITDAWISK